MDQSGADPLLDQLSERLGQILTNPEMLEASQTIAQAVTEALEGVEVSPDTVKEVAIAALGGAIERAENAVTSAENLLRGR